MASFSCTGWIAELGFMPSPDDRVPITPALALRGLLPVYLIYYIVAVLAIKPDTLQFRLSLLPLGLILAFRAFTQYDVAAGNQNQKFQNFGHCVRTAAAVYTHH